MIVGANCHAGHRTENPVIWQWARPEWIDLKRWHLAGACDALRGDRHQRERQSEGEEG